METVAEAFRANERLLWGLGYRMTGLASDADELVQETFLRALEHRFPDDGRPLRPWLLRVCANLARDRLRARRRRAGGFVWLPAPVPSERLADHGAGPAYASDTDAPGTSGDEGPEARYDRAETVGLAFLLALEALTPTQRAVLLLRDVFDLDAEEVADALGSTPGAVRAAHHKARRSLARERPSSAKGSEGARGGANGGAHEVATPEATVAALTTFLGALGAGDAAGALALLAPEVVLRSDGGGTFHAARLPVRGAEKVVRFLSRVAVDPALARWAVVSLNGAPMVVIELDAPSPGQAPRSAVGVTLDGAGRIDAIHWVLDPAKLTEVARLV